MSFTYSGTRALIMGGTCQMALDLSRTLIDRKIMPMLTYRSPQGLETIEAVLRNRSGQYAVCPLDLARSETLSELDEQLNRGLDYLVDFAQEDLEGLVASVDPAAMRGYLETNIAGRTAVMQRVARSMLAGRFGRMVHVSSLAAERPNPGQGFYAASKLAAEALYKNMGVELAARGITTVSLRPGYVDAGRGRDYLDKHAHAGLDKVPLGRALLSKEVVDTILFLLCDSAAGINAAVVTMDGGLAAAK
jgi:3-oxoacyl-[acyl-carrier protein] reductase